ncbi:MAG TPA: hypothetical protein VF316_24465 [Polyangiaceae bacterium]
MSARAAAILVLWFSMSGCVLIVGTDTRVLGDGGVQADSVASDARACASLEGCVSTENQCQSACDSALSKCQEQCQGQGPRGDKCAQDCKAASQTCGESCTNSCSSCVQTQGCAPSGC